MHKVVNIDFEGDNNTYKPCRFRIKLKENL